MFNEILIRAGVSLESGVGRAAGAVGSDISNPLDGVTPDFSFSSEFDALWKQLIASVWGLGLLVSIAFMVRGLVKMGHAGENPQLRDAGHKAFTQSLIAFGVLAALAIVVGAILAVVG